MPNKIILNSEANSYLQRLSKISKRRHDKSLGAICNINLSLMGAGYD